MAENDTLIINANNVSGVIIEVNITDINDNLPPNISDVIIDVDVKPNTVISGDIIHGGKGQSAYDIAVSNGFEGTVEEWLLSLEGEPAPDIKKWIDYVLGYSIVPLLISEDATKSVYQYTYADSGIKYRKISKTNIDDEFYDDILLTTLVAKKEM